jgi:enamine deaminase RidA (YjgF/YER057c/UK114 family)
MTMLAFVWPASAQKKKRNPEDGLYPPVIESKKKKDENVTQTLPPAKELPSAVIAETSGLAFQVSPLSSAGLLSQQTRSALKILLQSKHGNIVKLRAFVAGSGDLRRVGEIVGETFTEKHTPLPALSVVLVGALPMDGAQVVLETITAEKRPVNPNGLAFVSGQSAATVAESLTKIGGVLRQAGMEPSDAARVTCFVSLLEENRSARSAMEAAFPNAAVNYVQMQRGPITPAAECEAVARLHAPAPNGVQFLDSSPAYSQMVLVSTPRLVLTGTQLAFGSQENDIKLLFERLRRALGQFNAGFDAVVMSHVYVTSPGMANPVRTVRAGFYNAAHSPASTLLPFEGLTSHDSPAGVDVIAAVP